MLVRTVSRSRVRLAALLKTSRSPPTDKHRGLADRVDQFVVPPKRVEALAFVVADRKGPPVFPDVVALVQIHAAIGQLSGHALVRAQLRFAAKPPSLPLVIAQDHVRQVRVRRLVEVPSHDVVARDQAAAPRPAAARGPARWRTRSIRAASRRR